MKTYNLSLSKLCSSSIKVQLKWHFLHEASCDHLSEVLICIWWNFMPFVLHIFKLTLYLLCVHFSKVRNKFYLFSFSLLLLSRLSCPTLCDPIDGSPPGSPVPGILQVRTLEWVTISFSNAWKWKVKVKLLSSVRLLETPRTAAHPAPPSMGFSRQEYWSGVPLPSPFHFSRI